MYATEAQATAVLTRDVARYKRTGTGGTSWKRLVVYRCWNCKLWHLGRASKAGPPVKPPTAGDLRRAAKRSAKEADPKAARAELYKDWQETIAPYRMANRTGFRQPRQAKPLTATWLYVRL